MEINEFFWTFTLSFWSHMYVFDKTKTISFLWLVIAGTGALKMQNSNNNKLVQIKGKMRGERFSFSRLFLSCSLAKQLYTTFLFHS